MHNQYSGSRPIVKDDTLGTLGEAVVITNLE
jgi:hypothetical protein